MLVVSCGECGKKYKIDNEKVAPGGGKFTCKSCGCIIAVANPNATVSGTPNNPYTTEVNRLVNRIVQSAPSDQDATPQKIQPASIESIAPAGGLGIRGRMLLTYLIVTLVMAASLVGIYLMLIPPTLQEQVNLRTSSVAHSFGAAVLEPILVRNYLRVNQSAEIISALPGVAYVAVVSDKGIVVAGQFGHQDQLSTPFRQRLENEGFPKDIVLKNKVAPQATEQLLKQNIDDQEVLDVAVPIGDTSWQAHVGMFTADINKASRKALQALAILLAVMVVLGGLGFVLMARTVSKPIIELAEAAKRISYGNLDDPIPAKWSGEVGDLAISLERMRQSINDAIQRLRKK